MEVRTGETEPELVPSRRTPVKVTGTEERFSTLTSRSTSDVAGDQPRTWGGDVGESHL